MWFRSVIDSLQNRSSRPPRRKSSPRHAERSPLAARRISLEPLEERRLLAFDILAEYATGGNSQVELEIAQIDAGSQPDLVILNGGGSGHVSVRLGNADGTFGGPLTSGTVSNPRSLAAGDLTGDGMTDLVTANFTDLSLLIGNGNGTFLPAQSIPLPGQFPPGYTGSTALPQVPISVAVGDLDGDGNLDLTVTGSTLRISGYYYGYYGGQYPIYTNDGYLNVLIGDGTGGFGTPDAYHLGANRVPISVAVEDLNNDGDPDVITANGFGLSALLGDGTGALEAPIHSGSGTALKSITFGDIDGDSHLDTVLRNGGFGLVVQKGDGAGHFTPSTSVNVGSAVQSAVMGDVNVDGKLDLVAASVLTASYYGYYYGDSTKQAVVILGDGQGNFALPQISVLGTTPGYAALIDVALADFSGDGLPELAVLDYYANTVIVASNDGDWTPPVELSISDVSVVEGHSGTVNAVFTVTLVGEHDGTASVDFLTVDYSASAGADYAAQSGSLSFGPGVFSRTITVPVSGDRLGEGDETFFVNLTNPANALVRDGQGVGTILDDEPRININHEYSVDPLTVVEGDIGTTPAVFTVSLSMPYDQEVTVDYSTLTGHTADIVAASGTLRFAPGETSKPITVQVVGDLLYEELEAFNVILANATPNASIAVSGGYCYIEDNDPSHPVISISDVTKNEGNSGTTRFVFTVSLSAASSVPVTVNYATANGSARKNDDYFAKSGKLTFAPGETSQTVTISVKGDKKKENHESFFVNLANANSAVIDDGQGEGTILNDDSNGKRGGKWYNQLAFASAVDAAFEDWMSPGRKKRGW
jgi:hypothetical protein